MTITRFKWSIDLYHQAIEAGIFDDQNVELLQGEIVVMPPEGEPHVYFSDRLSKRLQKCLDNLAQIREGRPITLPNNSEPEPDIAVVQPLDTVYLEHHPYPENIFLVIEYSYASLRKDLKIKSKIYAEAGIREYWIVNLQSLQLIVFRNPTPTGYETEFNLSEGTISPLAFEDLQIEVRQLFSV